MSYYRGLRNFISDIRGCASKDAEEKRINKELANIRKNFRKSDLDGYNKKKYVWKLLYVHLLGYDVEFGHMEAVNLVTSTKYSEKSVGYVAISLLLNENDEVLRLIINSVRQDILGRSENAQCLALAAIANVGGVEFAESLSNEVSKLLTSKDCRPVVRKKAALCLLRLFRRCPEIITADVWADKLVRLLDDRNTGVVMAVLSLLRGICEISSEGYEECVPRCVRLLTKVVMNRDYAQDYVYANVPCPWMQVKALQLLQYFPADMHDKSVKNRLADVLTRILGDTHPVKNVNRNNTMHAILFEAIRLIIELNFDPELLPQAAGLLGRFVSMKDSNMKYLGLEAMSTLAKMVNGNDYIRRHQNTVTFLLGDADISIRRRALDLAYEMCDKSNVQKLVEQLLEHLAKADYVIREELVLKISILAQQHAADQGLVREYLDYVLRLIEMAGGYVSDNIWHKAVRVITNNEDLQAHAAETIMEAVKSPRMHATGVKFAAAVLGEFGYLIHPNEGCNALQQCEVLYSKFPTADVPTRRLIFSALCKLAKVSSDVKDEVLEIASGLRRSGDADLQQRAVEFCVLAEEMPEAMFKNVFDVLPMYPEAEAESGASPKGDGDDLVVTDSHEQEEEEEEEEEEVEDLLGSPEKPPEPAPGAAAESLEDLMTSAARPTEPAAAASSMDDLNSLLGVDTPAVSQGVPASAAPIDTPATLRAYATLCRSQKGALYEDANVQIGWMEMQPYKDRVGTIGLFIANKQSAPLTQFSISITNADNISVNLGPLDGTIPAGGERKQQGLQARIEQPFADPPVAVFNFNLPNGQSEQIALRIPITACKFGSGYSVDTAQKFSQLWQQGAACESQATIETQRPLERASLEGLLSQLNCANMASIDPNPANIVAGIQLACATGQQWCLLRLECTPSKKNFRLTARSMSKGFAEGVVDTVRSNLLSV